MCFRHSTSPLGGNLVDRLPRALHTEAFGVPHGGLGPAPIYTQDPGKLKIEGKCRGKLDQRFVQVLDHILRLLPDKVVSKIVNESEVSIPVQIFTQRSKIEDFFENLRFSQE